MPVSAQLVRSRRAVLGAAVGAAAAGLASAVARPAIALATADDGSVIHVGDDKESVTTTTMLKNQDEGQTLLWCELEPMLEIPATATAAAILGVSSASQGVGVRGHASTGTGLEGTSTKGIGVEGISFGAGFGVHAVCDDNAGVYATSANGIGVNADGGTIGVYALSRNQVGIHGVSVSGRGGVFEGGRAQIRLAPSSAASHPSEGKPGDLFVDSHHRLWFCKGGTRWHLLA